MSWEWQADRWLRWARTPGHDSYWDYREAFFAGIVPKPGRRTLEVGCGEGRVARDLVQRGHQVVAVDMSPTLVGHAAEVDPDGRYLVADAAALPFRDGSFDAVVAYNSLMDVDDMRAAVAEAARVLEPGGRLCVCVTHPTADAGSFDGNEPDAPFTIPGAYLGRHWLAADLFERDGLDHLHRLALRPGGVRRRPGGRRPAARTPPRAGRPSRGGREPPELSALAAPPHVPPLPRGQALKAPRNGGRRRGSRARPRRQLLLGRDRLLRPDPSRLELLDGEHPEPQPLHAGDDSMWWRRAAPLAGQA
jgi:SAM-dependent methyltransferase